MRSSLNPAIAAAAVGTRVEAPVVPDTRRSASPVAVDAVSLRFGDVDALSAVSLDMDPGTITTLLGPSGSGKSTLLRVIAGFARPDRGTVRIGGVEVCAPGVWIPPEQRRVGMVFQDAALFPHLTIAANVAFGLRGTGRGARQAIVADLLGRLGLSRYATSYPHMLSGGERQRVALARALAPRPHVLLMDEPFSGLDGRLRDRVRDETVGLLRETATTTVIVTHDPDEALRVGDRVALLHRGRLVQYGPARAVYTRPESVFAARLLSEVNELAGRCRAGLVDTPLGAFPASLPDDTPARVCIRPQHLREVDGAAGVRATVMASEFAGDWALVTCCLDGAGGQVRLRARPHVHHNPGDTVFLQVDRADVIVVPDDDAAASRDASEVRQ
jgi:iron(III) transport system ATP-binding protein